MGINKSDKNKKPVKAVLAVINDPEERDLRDAGLEVERDAKKNK